MMGPRAGLLERLSYYPDRPRGDEFAPIWHHLSKICPTSITSHREAPLQTGVRCEGQRRNANTPPPAITSAIHDAVRRLGLTYMPATPDRILRSRDAIGPSARASSVVFDDELSDPEL